MGMVCNAYLRVNLCIANHESLGVCEVSDTYLLGCLKYRVKYILISCGCVLLFKNVLIQL